LAAANLVTGALQHGALAEIISAQEDELHVVAAKGANQVLQSLFEALPLPFKSL